MISRKIRRFRVSSNSWFVTHFKVYSMFDGIPRTCSDVDPLLTKDQLTETLEDDARNCKFETKSWVDFIIDDSPVISGPSKCYSIQLRNETKENTRET